MSRSSSAVVDSKVVEMTLDNSNFEQNATKSLTTLQKLKEALNFTNSKDGFEKAGGALKKIDTSTLTSGLQAAKKEFSALDKISFGFFSKLGGQLESTTMKYAQMFSGMKQASDGFGEYELKMGSVQTILMGAKTKEGLPVTLDMVNQKLDELNTYADKTIYSFSDMTASIGKFTNAGVDLDTAVAAIQGISNEAALSGANAQQASHAMYNFAQALSSGYVKLIDWKSIENANMATVDFKQTLIDTAVEIGTLTKQGDKFVSTTADMNGKVSDAFDATTGFNDSLAHAWMSTDVLTAALGKYADGSTEVGKKAFQAATEVKTFTQLMDTLQEAAGSGWAQTWELIIGDFEESKSLFTMLSDTFGGIIDAQAKARNALLEEGLGGKSETQKVTKDYINDLGLTAEQLKVLSKSLIEVGKENGVAFAGEGPGSFLHSLEEGWLTVDTLKEKMKELNGVGTEGPDGMSKSLDEMREAALKVIKGGEDGYSSDMAERFKQLTEDGFDPEKIQAYVNEIKKLTGGTWEVTDAIMEEAAANVGLNETMTKSSGLFDDVLDKVTTGGSGKPTGRELLFDALKTSLWSFMKIASTIKMAWQEVFPPASAETIYKIAEGLNSASKALRSFAIQNAERIRIVFKAIFNVLDLVLRTGKAVIKGVFEGLKKAFSGGNGEAGAFIEKIAKLINKFHDWVVENEIIEKAVAKIGEAIGFVITTIGGWIDAIGKIPQVQNIIESFSEAFGWIGKNVGPIFEEAGSSLSLFGGRIVRAFQNADSPAEFFKRIKAAFDGLWDDLTSSDTFGKIKEAFEALGENIKSFFNDIGNNEDGTRNTFGKILDAVKNFKDNFLRILSGVDENGEKINVFETVKEAFTGLWDDISASGVIENIKDALNSVWEAINDFFTSLGTNDDGSLNLFGHIWETISKGFTWVREKAAAAKDAISNFFSEFKVGEFLSKSGSSIFGGLKEFFTSLPEFFSGAKDKFSEFAGRVKKFGGFKEILNPKKFGQIWTAFKDTVGNYFKNANIFKPIKTAFLSVKDYIAEHFGDLIEKIKTKFAAVGEKFGWLSKVFTNIKDSLSLSFGDLVENGPIQAIMNLFTGEKVKAAETGVSKIGKSLKTSGKNFKDFFTSFKDGFKNSAFGQIIGKVVEFLGRLGSALLDVKPDTIFKIVEAFVAFKVIKGVWNEIKGFVGDLIDSITGLWDSMAAKNKAQANFINKAALLELAAAIAIVGYVIYQLSQIEDMEKAWNAFGILAAMLGVMFVVSLLMSKLVNSSDMMQIGAGLILFGIACAAIGFAISEVANIKDMDKAWNAFGILAAILAVAAIVLIVGSKLGAGAASFGVAMIEMAAAFLVAAIALKVFSTVDFEACVQNLVDAVKAWNNGISEIESDGIDLAKSAALIAQLKGIAWVLKDAAIDGFIIAVGDFVSGLLGQGTVMENFGEGVKGLVDAIVTWNTEIETVPLNGVGVLKSAVFIAELAGISKVLLSATIAGFIGAVAHFVTDLMGQDPPMAQFKQGITDLVESIRIWNNGMDELPPNGWNVLKSAVFLTELAAITVVLGAAEIVGFLKAVMTFVTNLLGQKPPMAQFKQGIQDLLDSIKIWNDGIAEVSFDVGGFLKSSALIATLAGITAVLGAAEITAFLGAVMDFVYKQMGGKETVMEKFKNDVGVLTQVITDWQTTTKKVNAVKANKLTQAVDNIVKVLDHISSSEFWTRIEEFITGGGDFIEDFKADATSLGEAITNFMGAFTVSPEDAEKAAKIVDALARLGGNMSMFVTDTSAMGNGMMNVDNFGEALVRLADNLTQFVENSPDSGTFVSLVAGFRSMVNASQVLTEMDLDTGDFFDDEKIEHMRTNVSILTGIVYAASGAGALALGVPLFTAALGTISSITLTGNIVDTGLVTQVVNNVGKLASMIDNTLKNLDTSGVDKFTGAIDKINSVDMSTASQKLSEQPQPEIKIDTQANANKGKEATDAIAGGIDSTVISTALNTALTAAISSIDTTGYQAIGARLCGDVAAGVLTGSSTIKTVLQTVIDNIPSGINTDDFEGIGTDLASPIVDEISNVNVTEAVNVFTQLGRDVVNALVSGLSKGATTVALMAKAVVDGIDDIDASSIVSTYGNIGFDIINALNSAISENSSLPAGSMRSAMSGASEAASGYIGNFRATGYNAVLGFARGISENTFRAEAVARAMAAAAKKAADDEIGVASPSKEMFKTGRFFVLGFANGINRFSEVAEAEAGKLADAATKQFDSAVKTASDLFLLDGDFQPTITPVMDLSEIESGAGKIDSILSRSSVIGLNFDPISKNAEAIKNRTSTEDILSALEDLGSSISNTSGDTYNINGITYDDGSNVANAVSMLVNAARIGRRA